MPVFRPAYNMTAPLERPAAAPWSTAFITRMYRYKSLLLRRWWILLLTICCGLFAEAWLIFQTPPSFQSTSKMMMAGKLNINQGPVYSEDNVNFYGTQIQLMQSAEVRRGAAGLVRSTNPELQPVPVELSVAQRPRTSIFELQAIGSSPDYKQRPGRDAVFRCWSARRLSQGQATGPVAQNRTRHSFAGSAARASQDHQAER